MSKPTNGKQPTGPARTTAGASRPLATKATTGATKTPTTPTVTPKRPVSTPLASRNSSSTVRNGRDTTAPRAGSRNSVRRAQESRGEQIRKLAPLFGVLGILLVVVLIFVALS